MDSSIHCKGIPLRRDKDGGPDPPQSAGASPPPGPDPPREKQRRASARNWQKKKQQTEDLQAAKNDAEATNEVMAAKNALMGHARCNHPAINSWLGSQAARYVLDRAGGDAPEGSGAGAAPVRPTAECK
ncbi:hypothetical protein Brms1b_013272 [Colletotrichum noveboracense]|nr:hypothetical protein Brms1b_013272 [Colletotrichum noveboracense]